MASDTAQGGQRKTLPKLTTPEERAKVNPLKFAGLLAQLGLILVIIRGFNVEDPEFFSLTVACTVGFFIHYLVPFRYKKHAAIILSMLGAMWVLRGTDPRIKSVIQIFTLPLIGVGSAMALALVFYAVLRLKINYWIRVSILLVIVAIVGAARYDGVFYPGIYWEILGSLFMFRLFVYAWEVRVAKTPENILDYLSYLIMLPNFYFTLFPVVDYVTFKRAYYSRDIHETAQRGVVWIARGVVQLMLYRLVYHYLVIAPYEVHGFWSLLRYIFPTYLLYLKVSGTFHVIVGMLHLFGYQLPETHRRWLLAYSFSDFWRRINIYWKDFMVKCFFFPAYFRLRQKNETMAMVVATIVVFIATTVLHGYQWFWLKGDFLVTKSDYVFWGILCVCVIVSVLRETKAAKKPRKPKSDKIDPKALAIRIVQTLIMYTTISVLWSMWSTPEVGEWFETVMYWR